MAKHLKVIPDAEKIEEHMIRNGFATREAFAIRTGVSQPVLRKVLQGEASSLKTIKTIVAHLKGLEPNDVILMPLTATQSPGASDDNGPAQELPLQTEDEPTPAKDDIAAASYDGRKDLPYKVTPKGDHIRQLIAAAGYVSPEALSTVAGIELQRLNAAMASQPSSPSTILAIAEVLQGVQYSELIEDDRTHKPLMVIVAVLEVIAKNPDILVQFCEAVRQSTLGDPRVKSAKRNSIHVEMEMDANDGMLFLKAFDQRRFDAWNCVEIQTSIASLLPLCSAAAILLPALLSPFFPLAMLLGPALSLSEAHKALRRALPHTEVVLRGGKAVFIRRSTWDPDYDPPLSDYGAPFGTGKPSGSEAPMSETQRSELKPKTNTLLPWKKAADVETLLSLALHAEMQSLTIL